MQNDITTNQWQEIIDDASGEERRMYQLPGFTLHEDGLEPNSPTEAEAIATGKILKTMHDMSEFGIGDWAIYCQQAFKKSYAQMVAETGLSANVIGHSIWLRKQFPPGVAVPGVAPSTHAAVIPLSQPERVKLLTRAKEEGLTRQQVREIVKNPARDANGERVLDRVEVVTVTTSDVRGAATTLASAFGERLPLLVAELRMWLGEGTKKP